MRRESRSRIDAVAISERGERRGIQIGPKIRIGGTVGKIGETIKKILPSAGGIIGSAALGPIGGAVGSKASGVNPVDDIKKGATIASIALPVAGMLDHGAGGAAMPGGDDPSSDGPTQEGGGETSLQTPVDWWGRLKEVGGDIAALVAKYGPMALEGLNISNAAHRQTLADQYATGALEGDKKLGIPGAAAQYAAKQPLRDTGIAGMLNPSATAPNLSRINNIAGAGSGNPFARSLPVAGMGGAPGPSQSLPVQGFPPPSGPSPTPPFPLPPMPGGPGHATPPTPTAPSAGGTPPAGLTLPVAGQSNPLNPAQAIPQRKLALPVEGVNY